MKRPVTHLRLGTLACLMGLLLTFTGCLDSDNSTYVVPEPSEESYDFGEAAGSKTLYLKNGSKVLLHAMAVYDRATKEQLATIDFSTLNPTIKNQTDDSWLGSVEYQSGRVLKLTMDDYTITRQVIGQDLQEAYTITAKALSERPHILILAVSDSQTLMYIQVE